MENKTTLDHLLKIEAEAAALVNEAQAEADRRTHENEEKNRVAHEERHRAEAGKRELSLKDEIEKFKSQYQESLDEYRKEISGVIVNEERFFALFNEYIAGEG
jgi:hypothetical protein